MFYDICFSLASTPLGEERSKEVCMDALRQFKTLFGRLPNPNELQVWIKPPSGREWTDKEYDQCGVVVYVGVEYEQGQLLAKFKDE